MMEIEREKRFRILNTMDRITIERWRNINNNKEDIDLDILYRIQPYSIFDKIIDKKRKTCKFINRRNSSEIIGVKAKFKVVFKTGISHFISAYNMSIYFKHKGRKNFSTRSYTFNPFMYVLFTTNEVITPEIVQFIIDEIRDEGYSLHLNNFISPEHALIMLGDALDYNINVSNEVKLWYKLQ